MGSEAEAPDLTELKRADPDAWNNAFSWFFGPAMRIARSVLGQRLSGDVEDVAIVAVEALVDKVQRAASAEELRRLVVAIARNKAISRVREDRAERHGGGRIESLDERQASSGGSADCAAPDFVQAEVEANELAERLRRVLSALTPPQGEMLGDRFLRGLSHEEIARKYGVGVKSVGIRLARALRKLRAAWDASEDEV